MNFIKKRLTKLKSVKLLLPAFRKSRQIARMAGHQKVLVAALSQHLGDNIAAEPLDSALKKFYPGFYIVRVVGKSFLPVVSNNPNIDQVMSVDCLSEWIYLRPLIKNHCKLLDYHVHGSFCLKYRLRLSNPNSLGITDKNYFNYGNLLQVFCLNCGLAPMDVRPYFRLHDVIFTLPAKQPTVVIHTSSNNDSKDWSVAGWIQLIKYFTSKGFSVVEVGLNSRLNYTGDNYLDYCGKMGLKEIAYLISTASYFVGIDSAFAHFANAFNIPRLILLGHFNNYKTYMPYSGMTANEEWKYIIHHDQPVTYLPYEKVREKIEQNF